MYFWYLQLGSLTKREIVFGFLLSHDGILKHDYTTPRQGTYDLLFCNLTSSLVKRKLG